MIDDKRSDNHLPALFLATELIAGLVFGLAAYKLGMPAGRILPWAILIAVFAPMPVLGGPGTRFLYAALAAAFGAGIYVEQHTGSLSLGMVAFGMTGILACFVLAGGLRLAKAVWRRLYLRRKQMRLIKAAPGPPDRNYDQSFRRQR